MNIFILDQEPRLAAQAHCDKHVPKMILESAQMLSTALNGPYKPTHKNHPCTRWVAQSQDNATWLWELMVWLNEEYKKRWGKHDNHLALAKCVHLGRTGFISTLPNAGLTPFALAMPDACKTDDAVESYRTYYRTKSFASWDRATAPAWW